MTIRKKNYLKYFYLSLPVIYTLIYVPYGFEDTDTGFILGLSWQFINGNIPYEDIIYIRPPVSYIVHSISLLFDNYSIVIDRALMYFQIFIYTLLAIKLMIRTFNLDNNESLIYSLSSLSFIISVHTFPPMGWHTVDGIFFSVIGLYIILSFNINSIIVIGTFFLLLGALSKQPYYLFPILILFYFIFTKEYKKLIIITLTLFTSILLLCIILYYNNLLSTFITLTTGQTKVQDLIYQGFISYTVSIKITLLILVPPIIVKFILHKFKYNIDLFFLLIFWVLTVSLYFYIISDVAVPAGENFSHRLFLIAIVVSIFYFYKEKKQEYLLIVLLLILSWCASISWGYNTSILFSAPAIFMLYLIFTKKDYSYFKLYFLVFYALFVFYIGYQTPYREDLRKNLTYNMEEIFPKLKFIYSNKSTYMKYHELQELILKYGKNFTVLPDMTLAHYISNTKNPIGIDWVMNAEINNNYQFVIKKLEDQKTVVFLKKIDTPKDGKHGSFVYHYIKNNWKKVNEYEFFDVYIKE